MERPDLAELATRATTLADAINEYRGVLDEAYTAALGESDPETDTVITPDNGDDFEIFKQAVEKAAHARFTLGEIVWLLATQQGLRAFEDQGVEAG